jgi:tetratricopeptide (TPR) repeat protein
MYARLLFSLLAALLSLNVASAADAAPVSGEAQAESAATATPSETSPETTTGITGQQLFQLLLGEVALQRDQLDLAVSAYGDLALRTRDLEVTKRAVELASAAQQYAMALELTRLWLELEPESQSALLAQINLLVALERIGEVDVPMAKLLAAEPDKLDVNFLSLNRLLARYPDKKAALAFIERLTRQYPDLPEAHYLLAVMASEAGAVAQARREAQQAQALKPEWFAPVLLEAQFILRESDAAHVTEAVALLSGYLKRNPDAAEARTALIRVLISDKRYKEAREQFDWLLKKDPDNPDVLYPVAMLALQEKDLDTARGLLNRLVGSAFSDQNSVHYFLGLLEEEAGNPVESIAHFEQVSGGVQYLFAQSRIAQGLAKQGKVDEALTLLQNINVRSPQDKSLLAQLKGQLLREVGRYQAAYEALASALAAQPEQPDLLYDVALMAEKAGKLAEMETHLQDLIRLQPKNAQAYNALGYSLADRNLRLEEAYNLIAKAVSLAPRDPFIMDSMGWVLYRQGKLEEALSVLERAYRIRADPEIAAHLGEALWMLGRQDEARDLWQKAATQSPENETLREAIKKFQP